MSQDAAGSSDGTQSSGPVTMFNDPISGPPNTDHYVPSTNGTFHTGNDATLDVSEESGTSHPGSMRTLLDGVFADGTTASSEGEDTTAEDTTGEDTDGEGSAQKEGRGSATSTSVALADGGIPIQPAELPRDGAQPGMLPRRRRTWPIGQRFTADSLRTRRGLRLRGLRDLRERTRTGGSSGVDRGTWKPSKGMAGVAVALSLGLLFTLVAVEFVASFIGMFSGIGS